MRRLGVYVMPAQLSFYLDPFHGNLDSKCNVSEMLPARARPHETTWAATEQVDLGWHLQLGARLPPSECITTASKHNLHPPGRRSLLAPVPVPASGSAPRACTANRARPPSALSPATHLLPLLLPLLRTNAPPSSSVKFFCLSRLLPVHHETRRLQTNYGLDDILFITAIRDGVLAISFCAFTGRTGLTRWNTLDALRYKYDARLRDRRDRVIESP
ncbi:hypothetical protein C8R47DRAFT_755542 [Mycena vitilis]|nr:hypothetical protein C8R47DRAFT_755542 [Mycena vitilis]